MKTEPLRSAALPIDICFRYVYNMWKRSCDYEFFKLFSHLGSTNPQQQETLSNAASPRSVPKGTVLHNGSADCLGLLLIRSGQLRAYILSDEGREITIYRLFEGYLPVFRTGMMRSIQFVSPLKRKRIPKYG